MIHQPFDVRQAAYRQHVTIPPENSPFTVDELVRAGVPRDDACMIVWPVGEEEFVRYLQRARTMPPEETERRIRERDEEQGPYIPHALITHHTGEARY